MCRVVRRRPPDLSSDAHSGNVLFNFEVNATVWRRQRRRLYTVKPCCSTPSAEPGPFEARTHLKVYIIWIWGGEVAGRVGFVGLCGVSRIGDPVYMMRLCGARIGLFCMHLMASVSVRVRVFVFAIPFISVYIISGPRNGGPRNAVCAHIYRHSYVYRYTHTHTDTLKEMRVLHSVRHCPHVMGVHTHTLTHVFTHTGPPPSPPTSTLL